MGYETLTAHNGRRAEFWAKVTAPLQLADVICDECGERMGFVDPTLTLATLPPPPTPLPVKCPQCGAEGEMLR